MASLSPETAGKPVVEARFVRAILLPVRTPLLRRVFRDSDHAECVCVCGVCGVFEVSRQKIFAFIRRCIRTGFCSPDLADFHDLYVSSNEKLFTKILTYPNHILRTLLPQNYSLRNRPHNRQLPDRISRITDCNFTVRMSYRNTY